MCLLHSPKVAGATLPPLAGVSPLIRSQPHPAWGLSWGELTPKFLLSVVSHTHVIPEGAHRWGPSFPAFSPGGLSAAQGPASLPLSLVLPVLHVKMLTVFNVWIVSIPSSSTWLIVPICITVVFSVGIGGGGMLNELLKLFELEVRNDFLDFYSFH